MKARLLLKLFKQWLIPITKYFSWFVVCLGLAIPILHICGVGVVLSASESNPHVFWLSVKSKTKDFKVGDYVAFEVSQEILDQATVNEGLVLKQILGSGGNVISTFGNDVFLNGSYISTALSKRLPISEQIIPEGWFYMYCPHSKGFDSRYADFGLVSKEQIKLKIFPIF